MRYLAARIRITLIVVGLICALHAPATACENGYFVFTCGTFGAPGGCYAGAGSGTLMGVWPYETTNNCDDCNYYPTGHIWYYDGGIDCDDDYIYFMGWACCPTM